MAYTGDKTDVTALVRYAQSLEAEIDLLRAALMQIADGDAYHDKASGLMAIARAALEQDTDQ